MKPENIYPLPDLGFFRSLLAVIKGYRVPNRRTTKEVLEIINNNPRLKALAEKDNSEKRKEWINYARLPASEFRRRWNPLERGKLEAFISQQYRSLKLISEKLNQTNPDIESVKTDINKLLNRLYRIEVTQNGFSIKDKKDSSSRSESGDTPQ